MSKMSKKTKTAIKFALTVCASAAAGFILSMILGDYQWKAEDSFLNTMAYVIPAAGWIYNLVICFISCHIYRKERKLWNHNEEDEGILDRLEYTLNTPLLLSNIVLIVNLAMFASTMYFTFECSLDDNRAMFLMFLGIAAMVFGMVWIMVLQGRLVAFEKIMNPEKKGDILDMKFQKEWMESCDEAQRSMVYRAAYSAFRAANMVCMACWAVTFIGMFTFQSGLLPIVILLAIHLTLIVTYTVSCMQQERPDRSY